MSGMEAVSAGIALGGFVLTTIQQVDKIITTLRNAQRDLSGLVGYLEQLKSSLTGAESVIKRLSGKADQQKSLERIQSAVDYCNKTLISLEVRVSKINGSDHSSKTVKKTVTSLKYYLKKDEILEVQDQLYKAMMTVDQAISTDNWHRTQDIYDVVTNSGQFLAAQPQPMLLTESSHSAPSRLTKAAGTPLLPGDSSQSVAKAILDTGNKQLMLVESMVASHRPLSLNRPSHPAPNPFLEDHHKPLLPIDFSHDLSQDGSLDSPSLYARRSSQMFCKQSVATMYKGMFGTVTILKKSKYAGSSLGSRTVDAESISRETVLFLRPSFWMKYFELRFEESYGRISRTLNVDRILDFEDPVFEMCRAGDIMGLDGAFRGGRASPDVVNELGMGLLHYAAGSYQFKMCEWLLYHGANVNRTDIYQEKALTHLASQPSYDRARVDTKTVVDIARLLAEEQEDLSAFDISCYFEHYHGPPEAVELILSLYPAQYDNISKYDDFGQLCYPTLASALKLYAREPSIWEGILRTLIRRGADLHALVRRNPHELKRTWYPCLLGEFGTPLDELFATNRGHEAAKMAADGWLQILRSEGHDLNLYLKNELDFHAKDMQFTHASIRAVGYDIPRRLFFEFGDHAKVFWDWWVDPASSTSLLREEFKCLATTLPDGITIAKPWQEYWPFVFPEWFELHQCYIEKRLCSLRQALLVQADDRAARRLKKKGARLTPAQRPEESPNLPGAWIA